MVAKNYKDISGLALILRKLSSRTVGLNPVETGSSPVRGRGGCITKIFILLMFYRYVLNNI